MERQWPPGRSCPTLDSWLGSLWSLLQVCGIENGPVKIESFPIKTMVIFHSSVKVYQRIVSILFFTFVKAKTLVNTLPRCSIQASNIDVYYIISTNQSLCLDDL